MKNMSEKKLVLILCLFGLCCMTQQSLTTETGTLSSQIRALTERDRNNYESQAPQNVEGRLLAPQKAPALEQIPLTVEYAAKLFFLSFRFSQGSLKAQKRIFYYLHTLHPDWNITDEFKEQLAAKSEQHIRRWLAQPGLPHKIISPQPGIHDPVKRTVEDEANDFQDVFRENPSNMNREVIVESVANHVIDRDFTYLIEKNILPNGRPRPQEQGQVTPLTDPFLSHLCHYGFLGNHTGTEEYDQMFRDITTYIKEWVFVPASG